MQAIRAARLPILLLALGPAGAILATTLTPSYFSTLCGTIAATFFGALAFLFKQLEVFEKAVDTPGLDSLEIHAITVVAKQRQRQIKYILCVGLLAAAVIAAPSVSGYLEIPFPATANAGFIMGCIVAFAMNFVFVYFDWRDDLVGMQQFAKKRNAQRTEADKALQRLIGGDKKLSDIGKLDDFKTIHS